MISNVLFDGDDTLWPTQDYYDETFTLLQNNLDEKGFKLYKQKIKENLEVMDSGPGLVYASLSDFIIEKDCITKADQKLMKDVRNTIFEHPVLPFPGVADILDDMNLDYNMMIVTKGALFEQERKIAASKLADFFDMGYEVMTHKNAQEYETKIFDKYDLMPNETVMVGNSLKSDILPALACGAYAIYVPYNRQWDLDIVEAPFVLEEQRFYQVESIDQVPEMIEKINHGVTHSGPSLRTPRFG